MWQRTSRLLGTLGLCGGLAWGSLPARAQEVELAPALEASRVLDVSVGSHVDRRPVITTVAVSPAGGQLAAGGDDHQVRITSTEDGRLLRTLDEHFDWVRAVVYRPDGAELATAGDDRLIHLWATADGQLRHTIRHQGAALRALAYSPDGQTLAAAGFDARISLYNAQTGKLEQSIEPASDDVFALAISPDGNQLAVAGSQGRVRIWDLAAGKWVHQLTGDNHRLRALAFSPDGSRLAAGGDGPSLYVWDPLSGQPAGTLAVRPGKVLSLTFCDPATLAAGMSHNQIKLYDLASGEVDLRMVGHTGSIATLVWDAARGQLISGGFDTQVRMWSFGQEEPATAREPTPAGLR